MIYIMWNKKNSGKPTKKYRREAPYEAESKADRAKATSADVSLDEAGLKAWDGVIAW